MNESKRKTLIPHAQDQDLEMWIDADEGNPSYAGSPASSYAEKSEVGKSEGDGFSSLRPGSFAEYIGQDLVKENIRIACDAALKRNEPLDHVLLHGPPGLGKTSLARLIAVQLGVSIKTTSGPVIEKAGDLAAILTALEEGDILFVDEIHRMPRIVEEVLYPAMEDGRIDILVGQGPATRSVRIDLKPFTLVGATTRTSLLTSPLRDRFGMVLRLNYYSAEELAQIVTRSAAKLGMEIGDRAALALGRRARGTPRIANRLLRRVRDFADATSAATVSEELVCEALEMLDIDGRGLDTMDRTILTTIIEKFSGGPVGIDTIAAAIGEEKATLEDVYEPYLLQEGFIHRTKQGRVVSAIGYQHLGIAVPPQAQTQLTFAPPQDDLCEQGD